MSSSTSSTTRDLEAKIVILGASNVGKTTLLSAYLQDGSSSQPNPVPTVGASFQTKRLISPPDAPDTTLRLQIWDTAGQERFRSISRLYYRGADAALLCYDVTDERSFDEMGRWMQELRAQCGPETTVHVVGTKADIVAQDPTRRQVPFERCIQYVAEHLADQQALSSSVSTTPGGFRRPATAPATHTALAAAALSRSDSNRHLGAWDQHADASWDCCHEISARDGEGVDEVFRVIVRALVERRQRRERALLETPGLSDSGAGTGYFDYSHAPQSAMGGDGRGSFRLTAHGSGSDNSKRRSWLAAFGGSSHPGTPGTPAAMWAATSNSAAGKHYEEFGDAAPGQGRCC